MLKGACGGIGLPVLAEPAAFAEIVSFAGEAPFVEMIPFAGIDTLAGAESDKVWTVFEALGTVPTASPELAAFPAVSPASKDSTESVPFPAISLESTATNILSGSKSSAFPSASSCSIDGT